jgi:uncharacterized membrane protein
MTLLALGLLLFLGVHSLRVFADGTRARFIAARGERAWKGLYALASLAGFALIVIGFGQARLDPALLWSPPVWTRHAAAALVLLAFVLITATYVPGNSIRAKLHHPMVLSVKTWAFAHLLANGRAADVLLFGAFLAWAIVDFASLRRRDRAAGTVYAPGRAGPTVITVVAGLAIGFAFAKWAHPWLFGVSPFRAMGG